MKHVLDFDESDEIDRQDSDLFDRLMTFTSNFKKWFSAFILRNDLTKTQASSESTDFI